LLEGAGNTNIITCTYHAWAYDLEGPLRNAPNWRNVEGFSRKDVCLSAVRVELFCGFVFVNLDADACALEELTGTFADEIRAFSPNCEDLVHAHRVQYPVKANWKVCAENFAECYHCRLVHPVLTTEFIEMEGYHVTIHDLYQRHHIKLRPEIRPSVEVERGAGSPDHEQASWTLWPHMAFQVADQGYLTVFRWIPVDADTTLFTEDWYFPNETPNEAQWELIRFRAAYTQPEDDGVCEAVQEGLHSRGYSQGRLMVDAARSELSEHGPHQLQLLTLRALQAL
jgi:choline monooxygenase